MNINIEFLGYPGSGKSHLSKQIKKSLSIKNISFIKSDKLLFNAYPKNMIEKFIYKKYYNYKINKKFQSNYLFKKQYIFLSNKINETIKQKKKISLINLYKSILKLTTLNQNGIKRSIDNFKICLCGYYLNYNNDIIYSEDGLLQSLYQVYKHKINKKNLKLIKKFLDKLPTASIVLILETKFNSALKRANMRQKGFNYYNYDINKIKYNYQILDKLIMEYLKKNRINILKIRSINKSKVYMSKIVKLINKQS